MKDPAEVVKVHQKVMVTVVEVDLARKRISLSMKANPELGGGTVARTSPGSRPQGPQAMPKPEAPKAVDWFTEAMKRAGGKDSR